MKSEDIPEEEVFQGGDIILYQGDCLDIMPQLEPGSVDLVLCDPPYGTTRCKWDTVIDLEGMWKALAWVTYERTPIVFCAAQPFTSALVMSNLKMFRYEWIWDKVNRLNGALNSRKMPLKKHENICVFYKKLPTYNPQMVRGAPYKHTKARGHGAHTQYGKTTTYRKVENEGIRYPVTLLSIPGHLGPDSTHPTQKPVALMEYLIKTYTNPGDTVLDFTMGSGTTGVACQNLGRKFIGIELDPGYFQIAKDRILREKETTPVTETDSVQESQQATIFDLFGDDTEI